MAYRDDLAWIHDVGFGGFAEAASPAILEQLRRAGISEGRIVDLGCGSGQWARALCDEGYDVFGVDLSDAMVRRARRRVPEARFVAASFLEVQIPACAAVTAIGEVLCYLIDEHNSRRQLTGLFRRVWRALQPGGLFVFDVLGPGQVTGEVDLRHRVERDWATVVEAREDRRRRLLTRRITTFRRVGSHYRRDEEVHRQRLFEPGVLAADLRRIGYRVRVRRGYGEARFPGQQFAVIARKP